jgi:hypothetical protein
MLCLADGESTPTKIQNQGLFFLMGIKPLRGAFRKPLELWIEELPGLTEPRKNACATMETQHGNNGLYCRFPFPI